MPHLIPQDALAAIIAPFAGAKMRPGPRVAGIDLHCAGVTKIDADVRDVTPEGVRVFFSSSCEVMPWADIYGAVVFHRGADGERDGSIRFEVSADMQEAA